MFADDGRGLLELAQLVAVEGEAAGHAEVADPGLAGREGEQQIFGAAVEAFYGRPFEALDEPFRKGKAKVGPVLAHLRQSRADEHRLKAAADGFDLGEFWHRF
jgi:hypothetical protein